MDTVSIAGAVLTMKADQTQQLLSVAMVKQAVAQENQMAGLIAQNTSESAQQSLGEVSGVSFSTYA